MKSYFKLFLILGSLAAMMTIFIAVIGFIAETSPPIMAYNMAAIAVISFCLSYLYPIFNEKNERRQWIQQKGMTCTSVAVLLYVSFFMLGVQFEWIRLSIVEVLALVTSLGISTLYISFVVLAKVY
ncbi:permease [Halobacillus sp. B23F22_1]|uniref:permease n=1 Tax=Halobacillus sp. B23F22_1 TaxID=3459514 RepID=UPI00373EC538